ncbi:hypothetical protein J4E83_005920 [Alternaria metachromatica]|uniref:uncharacterized protein n=1 Tax=Alternaria metachromatica TaxID=283354 RepID=UPI0020C4CD31|nr:uncharacterized protein J4E83_005920 [Alternaria metachromatica]KAI4618969.1 hypothetical protein J4E83_005920 [Alternaria metachromatica]
MMDLASQLHEQFRLSGGQSFLAQNEIEATFAVLYGESTEKDRTDFDLLFRGLNQDIWDLQHELSVNTVGWWWAGVAASRLYDRLNGYMDKRVRALANGSPILVKGLPPTMPGPMLSKWASDYVANSPAPAAPLSATPLESRRIPGETKTARRARARREKRQREAAALTQAGA